jgi:hypothetical protein
MKIPQMLENTVLFVLVALSLLAAPAATAQTVISNETLVSTTFVVSKTAATAKCGRNGCIATTAMLAPVPVTCPAATGQTCTFHISLEARTAVGFPANCKCAAAAPGGLFQFLIDGAPPTIGPTSVDGNYVFERWTYTSSIPERAIQSYPASVLTTVTNSSSNSHTIVVNLGCQDSNGNGGCAATAQSATMTVDVFEP